MRSCSGTTSRWNSPAPTPGYWICAAKLRPPLACRMANAGFAAFRPQAMTRSGQGGLNSSPVLRTARSGISQTSGGRQSQGKRTVRSFSRYGKPTASARPSALARHAGFSVMQNPHRPAAQLPGRSSASARAAISRAINGGWRSRVLLSRTRRSRPRRISAPRGVVTSTLSPLPLPISARARGEVTDSRPALMSASSSPTIRKVCSSSVSSSARVTLAPN